MNSPKYACVLVNIRGLDVKTFSYIIPPETADRIQIGQIVLVPFGRQGLIKAFVVGFSDYLDDGIKAKKINKILTERPLFSQKYLKLIEWISDYYCCDFITVLNTAIPLKLIEKTSKTEVSVELCSEDFSGLTKRQLEIIKIIKATGKISATDLENKAKTTRATLKKLQEKNVIKLTDDIIYRNPLKSLNIPSTPEPLFELSKEQNEVYEGLKNKLRSPKPLLLHGITASGKTEIYFKLIKDVIDEGKNVLFLAPEIALASQLVKRLARKFGTDDVAIWHSSISDGEKYDVWQRLYNNDVKILAGVRSAVFAPLTNIGLIIIDEEHENSYKQTSPAPRYDARLVAQKLSQFYRCPLIFGSATPDISTYYIAANNNNLFELKTRYNNAPLAKATVINMQEYALAAYKGIISKPLQTRIKETLDNKKQVILLINRRGYSTYTQCRACGEVLKCPNCAIPMIWHANTQMLECHYCGKKMSFPDTCPSCGSEALKNSGIGTQKVEMYIKELYPEANVARIDSDILVRKNAHIEILDKFQKGEIDILVGTQMIAKGLDNPNVTLVGVISADSNFNMPDYRAAERGFQLLMQVAGRAGRGKDEGEVIFQTYNPDFYAFNSAKIQNYDRFYNTEIKAREEFDYPPFSKIIRIILTSESNIRAEKSAREIALRFNMMVEKFGFGEYLSILGPSACVIEKINGSYRFQILVKNKLGDKGHDFVSKFLDKIKVAKDIRLTVDVDPMDIL